MVLKENQKPARESNIELLRIVLMLMIVGYHLLVHGADVGKKNFAISNESSIAYVFLRSFLVISVNCFVFISGYYRINFRIYTFLSIILQTAFFAICITLAVDALALQPISMGDYAKALVPTIAGTWWFITAYMALYLLSPLLNKAVDAFNKSQFLFVLGGLTIINSVLGFSGGAQHVVGVNGGYSLIGFMYIYLVAQFFRKYVQPEKMTKYAPVVYVAISFLLFLLAFLSITELGKRGVSNIYSYNNPLVLVAAICFFFLFKSIHIKSGFINSISPYVLGVYLFHDHFLMREHLIERLFNMSQNDSAYLHFFSLLLITVAVFFAGYLVDRLKFMVLAPLTQYMIDKYNLQSLDKIFLVRSSS